MVRTYLRHGPTQAFGLICGSSSNSQYDGKLAYVPALEDVLVWDVKKGQMLAMWHETGQKAEVTYILQSPQRECFAVGYADGSVRLWNSSSGSVVTTFNGHKRAVTSLAFDAEGTRLASGSQDTDVILWDIVAEAGLFRLCGHRDQITAVRFLSPPTSFTSSATATTLSFLLTTSKDTFMKLWDLSTQHCVQTIVSHRSEIWSMDESSERNMVFTGGSDGELRAWRVDYTDYAEGLRETESGEISKIIYPIADLPLSSRHRVSQVTFHPTQPYLAVQSQDHSVEIFRIRSEEEVSKKQARRRKREREKEGKSVAGKHDTQSFEKNEEIKLVDLFTPYLVVHANGKIRSFDFGWNVLAANGVTQLLLALSSNSLEVYSVPPPSKSKDISPQATLLSIVDIPGHRTDVRTLCLSSDDQLLASASNGLLKVWNLKSTACIRTIECEYPICSAFLPGDRHVAVGTKNGHILIYDIASSSLIEAVEAHSSVVWSLHIRADGRALVSGSADKTVKFWNLEHRIATDENAQSGNLLILVHIRTLKMSDDVLSVKYSPNGKLLAVSLLDSTVKVFFQDTLKFFLSLYGHKLPVLSMDISEDSKLIATCSADKNVKIWGLDFGDCHKSIFAHDESIMQVAFEKNSHYFWTVGKDKQLKYWDGDKFENIQNLWGHHGEIWALAVSNYGNFVVTGSQDKSIRVWEKLDEPLFLEEERERELELLYDSGIVDAMNRNEVPHSAKSGEDKALIEVTGVSKQTAETMLASELIMEALELADTERAVIQRHEEEEAGMAIEEAVKLQPPPKNPILAAYDLEPEAYVLQVVERIQVTALHDALLILPFGKVVSLMTYLTLWAQREWNITLVSRIAFFLLKIHHHQIVANRIMRTSLIPLRQHLRNALRQQKEMIGYNLAALQHIRQREEHRRTAQFFEEEPDEEKIRARLADGKKRKRVSLKA